LQFFESLAPEERSLDAWYEASRARMAVDLKGATVWLDSLPGGAERDAAATAMFNYLMSTGPEFNGLQFAPWPVLESPAPYESRDPATAFRLAAGMSGEEERARFVSQAAQLWALRDPAAAAAAVASTAMPEAARQTLLRQLSEGGGR
jgi:hypothetical protein